VPTKIIKTDITADSNYAFAYVIDDLRVIVNEGVHVTSQYAAALFSHQAGSALINSGHIRSTNGDGVSFENPVNAGRITNKAGATIVGSVNGVDTDRAGSVITNSGKIRGLEQDGVLLQDDAANIKLKNFGEILGHDNGIHAFSSFNLINAGKIKNAGIFMPDAQYGILIETSDGKTSHITNLSTGVIRDDIVIWGNTSLSLYNLGEIDGKIRCSEGGGDTVIINRGVIDDWVELGPGDDKFISPLGLFRRVEGFGGNDRLVGNQFKNLLIGGLDRDTMKGGDGADTFVFQDTHDSIAGSRDHITDFVHAQHDKISLFNIDADTVAADDQAFHFIGKAAFGGTAGELRVEKHRANVIVSGDVDGDGVADFEIAVHTAQLVEGDFVL